MFRTLYGKLALALLLIFAIVGAVFLLIARFATDLYYQEVTQRLNSEIADFIVAEETLIEDGQANAAALKELAHMVMIVNPSVEVYLLDQDGGVLAYDAPDEKIKRRSVDLSPIHQFFVPDNELPILGDDPRDPAGRKIFTAARVVDDDSVEGYLYAILGGEKYDAVARAFRGSYIRRLSGWAVLASLAFAFLTALLVFEFLTRRLRRLTENVRSFEEGNFTNPVTLAETGRDGGDEIDSLAQAFSRMSQRIIDQVKGLKNIDSLRRELITNVSHDLRTPLASMQGYIDTVLLKGDALSGEEQRRYLEVASRHGEQLKRLVEQLFELARLDSETIEPHIEPFPLAELIQDVAQKFQLAAEERNVRLEAELISNAPLVNADIGLMERVLENLIENAMRYTPAGGTIRLSVAGDGDRIRVDVSDTGTGIPEEDVPYVFDRLYRASNGRRSQGMRTGLGLAIVKRILELHDSPITVESQVDVGTTFSFDLPRSTAAAA